MQWPVGDREHNVIPGWDLADGASAEHGGTSGNKIAHPNVFQCGNFLMPVRRPITALTLFGLVKYLRVVKTERTFGVVIQKVRLFLKFIRRGPVIVAIQHGNVVPPSRQNATDDDLVTMDILF